jgi:hypothetical protein
LIVPIENLVKSLVVYHEFDVLRLNYLWPDMPADDVEECCRQEVRSPADATFFDESCSKIEGEDNYTSS